MNFCGDVAMTRKELSQLYYLRREIDDDKARLAEIRARATSSVGNVSATPSGGGVSDKVGNGVAAEADLYNALQIKLLRLTREKMRLLDWIGGIGDPFMRRVLMFKYYDGLTWSQVAQRIGGYNSAVNLRKLCSRFISKN